MDIKGIIGSGLPVSLFNAISQTARKAAGGKKE